jgi:D-alanyl-D-alanine carboxypeptidase/D-alanyl-D-alanine-endopeptidase (penicillin-binding protein 4)
MPVRSRSALRYAAVALICACIPLEGASLQARIQKIVSASPALADSFVGVQVVSLGSRQVLAHINASHFFVPASNTKLFTTALALSRLGADYRFTTRVLAPVAPVSGVLAGDLVLAGGGDPTMSSQGIPFRQDAAPVDPMNPIRELAREVYDCGVRVIKGDIVGDDTAYVWEPYPPDWAADDAVWDYGSPVGALNFNDNSILLEIAPGTREGAAVSVSPRPALEYYTYDNRLRTTVDGKTDIEVERAPGTRQVILRGTVKVGKEAHESIAVDDPALFAATALYYALMERGIAVHGRPVSRHRWMGDRAPALPPVTIAQRTSPPLIEILRVTAKISSNLWAELVLREVGRVRTGEGSRQAGLSELAVFLKEAAIGSDGYTLSDGSGLSRLNLATPAAVVQLLEYMNGPFRSLLPIGGVDGTLATRFGGAPSAHEVQAKTGSLTHVNALSGYARSRRYGDLAFSIFVNNTPAANSEVRSAIDKIGLALVQ